MASIVFKKRQFWQWDRENWIAVSNSTYKLGLSDLSYKKVAWEATKCWTTKRVVYKVYTRQKVIQCVNDMRNALDQF